MIFPNFRFISCGYRMWVILFIRSCVVELPSPVWHNFTSRYLYASWATPKQSLILITHCGITRETIEFFEDLPSEMRKLGQIRSGRVIKRFSTVTYEFDLFILDLVFLCSISSFFGSRFILKISCIYYGFARTAMSL